MFKDSVIEDTDTVSGAIASVVPSKVPHDDYDFTLNLSTENLGVEGNDLEFKGSGNYDGDQFTFRAPIKRALIKYSLGEKWVSHMEYTSKVFKEDEWAFEVDAENMQVTGADLTPEDK